jgi:integrase/recombinase XerD
MIANGNSPATAQIYLRGLRAIFNKAITDGYIPQRFYPFRKYTIGTSVKSKNVLYPEEVKALYEFQSPLMRERRAKDYWLFCYLANGINPKDMMYMRYKNIHGEYISIVREKTKRTNTIANKEIKIYLHPEMQRIINEWGNNPQDPEQYVFPILYDTRFNTSAKKEVRRKTMKKKINHVLHDIGEKLGFTKLLNLNLARHSFGTNLKLQGTPIEFIRDLFGHSTSATTAHYLKTLPDNKTKEISQTLLNF